MSNKNKENVIEDAEYEDVQENDLKTGSEKGLNLPQISNEPSYDSVVDTNPTGVNMIGYTVIIVIFGFLLGWAYTAPLDSASYATGIVTVESYRKTIQHLEGGIVKEINTEDGQLVKKGDVLIVLDETQLKAQLEITKAQYISSLALVSRLKAERDSSEKIIFDQYLLDNNDLESVTDAINLQSQIFKARQTAMHGEVSVLKQRIEQLKEQTNGIQELQNSEKKEIELYKEEITEFQELLEEGFTNKSRMRDMQRRVAQLEGEVSKNTSAISGAKIQIGEAELQILQIEKNFQLEVAEQLSKGSIQVNDLKERIIAIEDKILRTKVVAPESGMVLGMTVHTLGGVIAPAKPILEIVPQNAELIVEAKVTPVDIDKVHTGLVAEIRFSSFKSTTTPIIDGEVINISPDSLIDQTTGMAYYLARVKVSEEGMNNLGDLKLLPGMPADVLIKMGERTVFQYLVQPINDAFARSFNED